jgi:hypothetical protein
MAKKMQRCDYCGEDIGVFEWRQSDGPKSCGNGSCSNECARDERDYAREQWDSARHAAEDDGYGRYGGPGPEGY